MSSLRVRNLIKRFSVNETESKFKSEAENQPNQHTNNKSNKRNSNISSNTNTTMETSDSDSDVTDLEKKIESLAQQKKQAHIAAITSSNNINGSQHPTNYATQVEIGVDVESSSEETKNSTADHVTEVRSVNDTNYLTPSEVRAENLSPRAVKPAVTLAINGNMNYLTSTEVSDNVYYTPRDARPEHDNDNTSKLGNTNYLTPSEVVDTRQIDDSDHNTINGNQTNYLMPDEIQPKNGNIYHTSTNYLMPNEVSRDSDSESDDLTPVTRQNVNYLTKHEVDELDSDSDPKLEIKIERANTAANNITKNSNAARASTTIDPNNRRSVLYLQPSEIQFSDDDDDEHVFGAATLHVPKLALPNSNQPSPRSTPKKGNVGYFESAPSRGSLQSAGSNSTLTALSPRVTARGPNYTGPSTLNSLNSARDELEDSFSDDETDMWSDTRNNTNLTVSGTVPASDSSDMYWNTEYQHVLAMSEGVDKYQRLSRLAQDFVYAAQTYGKIIITERYLPTHRKTIKNVQSMGGVAGGDKYKVQGILFKFAVDTNLKDKGYVSFDYWMYGGYRQSDRYAAKAAGHELKGLISYYNATVPGLHYPLMALIDYRGFRLIAMSLVPVTSQTLKYGSADAGKTIHTDIPELNLKMETVAQRLNLKKHRAGDKEIAGPSDIEGHCSADNKFYVLDFARVFPPEAPLKPLRRGDRRVYYQLLRAELVRKNPVALNSDVFTNFNTHNKEHDELQVEEATLLLFNRVIPDFAAKIGKMSKVQLQKTSIIEEMHREGINVRHLGRVRALIDLKASGPRTVLLIEMIARVAKNKWRRMMRHKMKLLQLPSEDPYRQLTAQYFNLLLGRDEQRSERLWKLDLKRQIMVKFPEALGEYRASNGEIKREMEEDYDLKRDWSSEDLVHLLTRVQELCGVTLSKQASEELQLFPRSISLLTSDIEAIQPRVKHLNVVEEAQAKQLAFQFQRATGAQATRLWALVNAKFRLAVASSTNSAETIYLWARVLFDQARRVSVNSEHLLIESRDKLNSCVELMPDKHVAWFTLGHVLMELSMRQHHSFHEQVLRYQEAAVAFRRAIQLDSSHVDELLQLCTENCRQITQITCSVRSASSVALEELFKCTYQLFKLVLEHRFSERIYIQLGNLLLDWAQTKSAAAADEHYIRAAIMYEAALRCSPLLIDQGTRYIIQSRDQIDDHVTIKQIAPNELGLSKPNIASRLTTPRVESGTTQPPGRSRENTISGGERPNLAMSDVVIKPLNLNRVAQPESGKTLKASKNRPTIPLSQLTQSQAAEKSQSSEEDTKHVIEHDKVVEIFAKVDGIWTATARYELPKRKSDSWLWFNLLSTSSDTLALDSCRNMFMNDDTCTVIRRDRVVNLCAEYEGTQFVLTRVTLKIPCDAVNKRGRILVFVLDKLPKIEAYEQFNDHTAESWKKFKVHVTHKRKTDLIGEGNEPVTWIDLRHEELTKNGNFYLVKKSIGSKKGKYLLIKIVNPPNPHDITSTAEVSEDVPLTVRYMGFKGYQTLTPLNDTQHVNMSITDLDRAQGLQLFDHVLEDQGARLASVLRTIKCSPLLAALFIVLTRHKTKLGNAIFSPTHQSSFCSVFYQPSRVVLPRVIPLHATNKSNDTNNTSLDLFLADCPAQVNLPLAKKLCQLFPNAIRSLDLAGADHLTDEAIFVFANSCQRLAHINLSKCPKISEQSVEYLLETKPGLKSLLLDSCTQFTDALVASIAKFGMALEHLALWNTVSDKSLQQLSKCLNLKHLQLINNHVISDKALAKLLKRLDLVSLNIDGCHSVNSNKTFAATIGPLTCEALTGHVHLTALSIRAVVGITDDTLTPVIEACPSLAVLMADDCPNIGKHTVQVIGDTLTPVKALSLRRTTGWSDVDDAALTKLFLAFDKPRADWSEVATKKNERKGRAATIARSSVKKKNRPALKIAGSPSSAVQFSDSAPNMEILDLYRCNKLTDASIAKIAAHDQIWQSLRVLDLSYCAQITDQGLMQLSKCSLLEDLRLEGCTSVSYASLNSVVEQCTRLTRVNVSGCVVSDGTVTLLATTHPNLEVLLLSGCQDITDQSLSILGKCCPQLKVLHIRGNASVTDVALLALVTCCTALRSVDMADCKNISVLHDLVKLLPGCHFDT